MAFGLRLLSKISVTALRPRNFHSAIQSFGFSPRPSTAERFLLGISLEDVRLGIPRQGLRQHASK